jgi:hypothetical protein
VRPVAIVALVVALASPTAAGELLFANGSRLEGDLAGEPLLFSTGSDVVEVLPEAVGTLAPAEIHLKDGRVLRGALVGGRVRARTALGELAIPVDELRLFRADGTRAHAGPTAKAVVPAGSPTPTARATPVSTTAAPADGGLPPVSLYQPPAAAAPAPAAPPVPPPASAAPASAPAPAVAAVAPGNGGAPPATHPRLEVVVAESPLHRDALSGAPTVGHVVKGEQVTYVDAIDRRLRIFNTLIFDGGHWIKVRAANGTEGWLPATSVREVR